MPKHTPSEREFAFPRDAHYEQTVEAAHFPPSLYRQASADGTRAFLPEFTTPNGDWTLIEYGPWGDISVNLADLTDAVYGPDNRNLNADGQTVDIEAVDRRSGGSQPIRLRVWRDNRLTQGAERLPQCAETIEQMGMVRAAELPLLAGRIELGSMPPRFDAIRDVLLIPAADGRPIPVLVLGALPEGAMSGREYIREGGVGVEAALRIVKQLAIDLTLLEQAGLVHAALDLDAFYVQNGDNGPEVILGDLHEVMPIGTWINADGDEFAAFEIKHGMAGLTPASNLSSLAHIFYTLATGLPPKEFTNGMKQRPEILSGAIGRVLERAFHTDSSRRHTSYALFIQELDRELAMHEMAVQMHPSH